MKTESEYPPLAGTPSDEVDAILATGSPAITTLFVSMAERHPQGCDADYLRWHSLDHRPEQQRLASLQTSLRVVSTPDCRRNRAAHSAAFDAVDHAMLYFFSDPAGLESFGLLSTALRAAGRSPFILNPVQRGVYQVDSKHAAPRARVGSEVLPWVPVTGLYLLLEQGNLSAAELISVPGVRGIWHTRAVDSGYSDAPVTQQLSCCFLDDDPVAVAQRLKPVLAERWQASQLTALLAAPFYAVVPYQWERYLP